MVDDEILGDVYGECSCSLSHDGTSLAFGATTHGGYESKAHGGLTGFARILQLGPPKIFGKQTAATDME